MSPGLLVQSPQALFLLVMVRAALLQAQEMKGVC